MCLGHAHQDSKKKRADAPRGKKKGWHPAPSPRSTDYICVHNLCVELGLRFWLWGPYTRECLFWTLRQRLSCLWDATTGNSFFLPHTGEHGAGSILQQRTSFFPCNRDCDFGGGLAPGDAFVWTLQQPTLCLGPVLPGIIRWNDHSISCTIKTTALIYLLL